MCKRKYIIGDVNSRPAPTPCLEIISCAERWNDGCSRRTAEVFINDVNKPGG